MKLPNKSAQAIVSTMAQEVIEIIDESDEPLSLWCLGHIIANSLLSASSAQYGGKAEQIALNESELSDGLNGGLNDYARDFGLDLKLSNMPAGKGLH